MLPVVTPTPLFLRSIQNCGLYSNINYSITYAFIEIFAIYFSAYPAHNATAAKPHNALLVRIPRPVDHMIMIIWLFLSCL